MKKTKPQLKQLIVDQDAELSKKVADMINDFKGQDKKGLIFSYHFVPKKLEPIKALFENYMKELEEQEREVKGDYSRAVHTGKILASYALYTKILSHK